MQIINVIVPTKKYSEKLKKQIAKIYGLKSESVFLLDNENGDGMSEKLNAGIEILNLKTDDAENKWVIFQHDDVKVLGRPEQIIQLIENTCKKISDVKILGIAGRTQTAPPVNPGIWWHEMGTPNFRGSGQVEHVDPKGNFFVTSYGPYPAQVSALDGCWFAVRLDALKNPKLRFDDVILAGLYHFYDADFCAMARTLDIVMATCGMHVSHDSRGEGVTEPEFRKAQNLFIKKWFKSQRDFNKYKEVEVNE